MTAAKNAPPNAPGFVIPELHELFERKPPHPSGGAVAPSPRVRCIITESVQWPNL